MKISIRKAKIEDAEALSDLAHELNLFHDNDTKPSAEKFREDWQHIDAYIAEENGSPVGFLSGYNNYQFHNATLRFEIQNLYVKESYRRHGVAKKLCANVIKEKQALGVEKFSLGVDENNSEAINFYESMGFKKGPQSNLRYALSGDELKIF